ncbi:CU044_2847 family protein [Streptomyces sp. NPDC002561]|uniref:CU044_2847 family protein n=1 Tax=Streptomyces sp. NPDC002561 TaxID=3154418 RepID=UPI00331951CD
MTTSVRLPLEGGGAILLEGTGEAVPTTGAGPVKAGRAGDALRELPRTLQQSLEPVREAAQAVMTQLRAAGPQSVTVEFGVNLAAKAGAIITSTAATAHLKVTLVWDGHEEAGPAGAGAGADEGESDDEGGSRNGDDSGAGAS